MTLVPAAALEIRGIDGALLRPLAPAGAAGVLLFVATDCPVSNSYAPEIQRICAAYAARGVSCSLIYEQPGIRPGAVRQHLEEYRYREISAAIDDAGKVAAAVQASVTPQAVVVDHGGVVRYRGRIDNLYAALGKPRQVVTSHDLRDALDAIVSGRPVARPETEALGCFIAPPAGRRK